MGTSIEYPALVVREPGSTATTVIGHGSMSPAGDSGPHTKDGTARWNGLIPSNARTATLGAFIDSFPRMSADPDHSRPESVSQ